MELGLHVIEFGQPGGQATIATDLTELARAADGTGYQHISVMDHFFQIGRRDVAEPMLEAYTTLAFLAAATERVKLHVLVTGVSYRYPGLLAKIVTTLDVLSGGRAELGLGAAWNEREHRALGVPFPPVAERFERLEETLQICLQMWSDNNGPFQGRHYQLAETLCSPPPLSQPRPRIIIGGGGERKTLRLVARYADASNVFATSTDAVAHKLDVLRRHCDDVGRDYDEISKTVLCTTRWPTADELIEDMRPYAELGVDTAIVMPGGERRAADVEKLGAEAIPRLAEL
jgi:F420-dependent oxidoreductase-like protein